jgi:hypothetical protein
MFESRAVKFFFASALTWVFGLGFLAGLWALDYFPEEPPKQFFATQFFFMLGTKV